MKVILLFISVVLGTPPLPNHSFVKKVIFSGKSVSNDTEDVDTRTKKVFVKFVQGPYTFKKRREKADRVVFTCNGCDKFKHYLPVFAWRERVDQDQEHDVYTLDGDTLPSADEHLCATTGLEDMVRDFRDELETEAKQDPTQPFPTMYQRVR